MKANVPELSRHAAELEVQNRAKQLEIERLKKQQKVIATCGKKNAAAAAAAASASPSTSAPPLPKADTFIPKQVSLEDDEQEQLARVQTFARPGSTFQSKLCRKRLGEMVLQNVTLKLGEKQLTVVAGSMLSYFLSNTDYDLKTIFKVRGDATSFEVYFIDGTTECFTPRQPVSSADAKFPHLSSEDSAKLMNAVKEGVLTQDQALACAQSAVPVSVVLDTEESDVMRLWRQFLLSRLLHLWGTDNVDISLPNRVGLWEGTHLGLEIEAKKRAAARAASRDKAIEFGSKVIHKLLDVEEGKDRHAVLLQISDLLPKVRAKVSTSQWQKLQERADAMRKDPNSFNFVQHKQLQTELEMLLK